MWVCVYALAAFEHCLLALALVVVVGVVALGCLGSLRSG